MTPAQVPRDEPAHPPDAEHYLAALGDRVRTLRLLQRLTQAQLADAAHMSRSFLSLMEHGVHGVDIALLYRLAHTLGIPLAELLPDDDTGHYNRPPVLRPIAPFNDH